MLVTWASIVVPIICTIVMIIFGWLWKQSIEKYLGMIDDHDKEIPKLHSQIALIKQDLQHFRERENQLIRTFEEKLSTKLDHIDQLFQLKFEIIEKALDKLKKDE